MARKCVHCRQPFEPTYNTLKVTCSPECSLAWIRAKPDRAAAHRARAERKALAEHRKANKTSGKAAAEAQTAFNAWIRARDKGWPCISCGHPDDGTRKRNAGHYIPVGRSPALRFDENNCHGQCEPCNSFKSGNLVEYRAGLIRRVGLAEVERLEAPHELPRRTREDFEEIAREYRQRLRERNRA